MHKMKYICFMLLTLVFLCFCNFPFRERLLEIKKYRSKQEGIYLYQKDLLNCLITVNDQSWTVLLIDGRLFIFPGDSVMDKRCSNSEFGYSLNHKDGTLTNKCLTPLKTFRAIFVREEYLNIVSFPKLWHNYNLLDVVNYLLIEKKCLLLR